MILELGEAWAKGGGGRGGGGGAAREGRRVEAMLLRGVESLVVMERRIAD